MPSPSGSGAFALVEKRASVTAKSPLGARVEPVGPRETEGSAAAALTAADAQNAAAVDGSDVEVVVADASSNERTQHTESARADAHAAATVTVTATGSTGESGQEAKAAGGESERAAVAAAAEAHGMSQRSPGPDSQSSLQQRPPSSLGEKLGHIPYYITQHK